MIIKLYDKENKKIIFNNPRFINNGSCGSIFKLDNETCLKYITDDYSYDIAALNTIINLNLSNFGKIYQLLYDYNGMLGGYIMKYYEDKKFDILTTKTEYTIENLSLIFNSIKQLTDKSILVKDLNSNNILLDDNLITIIDYDMYKYSHINYHNLNKYNNELVLYLFKCLYIESLSLYHKTTTENIKKISELFNYQNSYEEIAKRLVKYKYPIDYIK